MASQRNVPFLSNPIGRYSIATMLICDHRNKILFADVGFCGSCHDARVYANSKLAHRPASYFSRDEYLLADSGYKLTPAIITPFRKSATRDRRVRDFNLHLAQARINVEHTIGMLKGRFQSLRGLRISIRTAEDHQRCVHWVLACVFLHNLLLEDYYNPRWTSKRDIEDDDDSDSSSDGDSGEMKEDSDMPAWVNGTEDMSKLAEARRNQLMEEVRLLMMQQPKGNHRFYFV